MNRSTQGFTIIELVVVILVLGILAAVAFPRFVDLRDQAHTAKNSGTGGAVAAAVNMVHASWLAGGATGATVTMEDGTVVGVTTGGWPENDNSVAPDDAVNATDCATMWTAVLQTGAPSVAAAPAPAGTDYEAAGAGTVCTYTYLPDAAPARSIAYDAGTGAVTIVP